jgi:hypothetical protein
MPETVSLCLHCRELGFRGRKFVLHCCKLGLRCRKLVLRHRKLMFSFPRPFFSYLVSTREVSP